MMATETRGGSRIERALCPVLIGREKELSLLEDALLGSMRGDGRVVVLAGDAGCGRGPSAFQFPVTSVERIEEATNWLDRHDAACQITLSMHTVEEFPPFVLARKRNACCSPLTAVSCMCLTQWLQRLEVIDELIVRQLVGATIGIRKLIA